MEKYVTMSKAKVFKCSELLENGEPCMYATNRSDVLKTHLKFTHKIGVTWVYCNYDECDHKSITKGNLEKHVRDRHKKSVYYDCPIQGCNVKIKQKENIKQHLITHGIGVKWFYCEYDDCKIDNIRFNKKGNYQRHLYGKHKVGEFRTYKCPECNVELVTKDGVRQHMAGVHGVGAKWYYCNEEDKCEYKTTRTSNLKRHIPTHSEEYKARQKSKEEKLYSYLIKRFGEGNIKREHQITFRCMGSTFCRIDFLLIKDGRIFMIECDEFQHDENSTNYTVGCETRRMYEAYASLKMGGNTLPVHFIRFNPDYYKVDGMPGPVKLRDRYKELYQFIENFDIQQEFSIHYLFYTTEGEVPTILDHWQYNDEVREYVVC